MTTMPSPTHLALALALAAMLAVVAVRRLFRPAKYARLPPGPASSVVTDTPIPALYPWRYFYTLSKQFGPLVTVWQGSKPIVVCNNVATAEWFLEKHARDTADRPRSLLGDEIFSHGKRILLVGHNERWRRLRKALHNPLQPASARELRPVQEKLARGVVADIVAAPDGFQSHIQTYAASLVVRMAYGRTRRAHYSDPDIRLVVKGGERLGTLLRPGSFKIETFPFLRYVPGYLKTVNQWADDELALFRGAFADMKTRTAAGAAEACFGTYLLEHQKEFGLEDDELAYLLGSVFGAGSDTSSSAITICVMAAATNKEAQRRVQKELDALCPHDLPTFADLEDAPVLRAFIAETFRWRPVSSGGFQHRTTADLAHDGFVIPSGTAIVGNHWGIARDEQYYGPNPEDFNIDRWLDGEGQFKSGMKNFQFGFGRRVCPGQHVANNSVLINAAMLLWAFDIGPKVDAAGKEVPIDTLAMTNTANSHPLPFKASLTPRRANLRDIVEDADAGALA